MNCVELTVSAGCVLVMAVTPTCTYKQMDCKGLSTTHKKDCVWQIATGALRQIIHYCMRVSRSLKSQMQSWLKYEMLSLATRI
jgi:hypothetical protein